MAHDDDGIDLMKTLLNRDASGSRATRPFTEIQKGITKNSKTDPALFESEQGEEPLHQSSSLRVDDDSKKTPNVLRNFTRHAEEKFLGRPSSPDPQVDYEANGWRNPLRVARQGFTQIAHAAKEVVQREDEERRPPEEDVTRSTWKDRIGDIFSKDKSPGSTEDGTMRSLPGSGQRSTREQWASGAFEGGEVGQRSIRRRSSKRGGWCDEASGSDVESLAPDRKPDFSRPKSQRLHSLRNSNSQQKLEQQRVRQSIASTEHRRRLSRRQRRSRSTRGKFRTSDRTEEWTEQVADSSSTVEDSNGAGGKSRGSSGGSSESGSSHLITGANHRLSGRAQQHAEPQERNSVHGGQRRARNRLRRRRSSHSDNNSSSRDSGSEGGHSNGDHPSTESSRSKHHAHDAPYPASQSRRRRAHTADWVSGSEDGERDHRTIRSDMETMSPRRPHESEQAGQIERSDALRGMLGKQAASPNSVMGTLRQLRATPEVEGVANCVADGRHGLHVDGDSSNNSDQQVTSPDRKPRMGRKTRGVEPAVPLTRNLQITKSFNQLGPALSEGLDRSSETSRGVNHRRRSVGPSHETFSGHANLEDGEGNGNDTIDGAHDPWVSGGPRSGDKVARLQGSKQQQLRQLRSAERSARVSKHKATANATALLLKQAFQARDGRLATLERELMERKTRTDSQLARVARVVSVVKESVVKWRKELSENIRSYQQAARKTEADWEVQVLSRAALKQQRKLQKQYQVQRKEEYTQQSKQMAKETRLGVVLLTLMTWFLNGVAILLPVVMPVFSVAMSVYNTTRRLLGFQSSEPIPSAEGQAHGHYHHHNSLRTSDELTSETDGLDDAPRHWRRRADTHESGGSPAVSEDSDGPRGGPSRRRLRRTNSVEHESYSYSPPPGDITQEYPSDVVAELQRLRGLTATTPPLDSPLEKLLPVANSVPWKRTK